VSRRLAVRLPWPWQRSNEHADTLLIAAKTIMGNAGYFHIHGGIFLWAQNLLWRARRWRRTV
jgi:hypothetical protein